MTTEHNTFKHLVAKHFGRAAKSYDDASAIQSEVAKRLLERLDLVSISPELVLDIGCGTGKWTREIAKRYSKSKVIGVDLSPEMICEAKRHNKWRPFINRPTFVCQDAENLAIENSTVDLIFSNFVFQWCDSISIAFKECRRVLKPGGLLVFTIPGPDTLKELKEAWSKVDHLKHVNDFPDMHDLGDELLAQKYFQPVMDMELITVEYSTCKWLLRDLKASGTDTVKSDQRRGMMTRARLDHFIDEYDKFRQQNGMLPATYEVIYGHAWAPLEVAALPGAVMAENVIPIKSN